MAAKVRMRSPDDGKVYEFDRAHAADAERNGWSVDLSAGQQLAKGVGGMLPPVAGAIGGAAGFLGGGGATAGLGAVPGAAVGAVAGGAMGEMGNQALQRMAGIDSPPDPMRALSAGAQQGTNELLGGGMNVLTQRGAQAAVKPLMRFALGSKKFGPQGQFMEDLALKHNVPVTQETVPFLKKVANAYVSGVNRVIAKETADPNGMRFSWNALRGALAKSRAEAKANDAISVATEKGLERAQNVLKYKYEGAVSLTPTQMQEIKRFAQEQVKKLYEARQAMKDPEVGPMEHAYGIVAREAQTMLEQIPLVAKRNRMASETISLQKQIWEAATRKPPMLVPGMVGAGSASLHNAFDPMAAGLGAAGFFGTQAALSPQAMSRLSLLLNSPEARGRMGGVAGQLPRAAATGWEALSGQNPNATLLEILGLGPQAPPEAQP